MRKIEWHSEKTEENYFNDFCASIKYGQTYHFYDDNKKGFVIYNTGYIENGQIVAIGKFGNTEIFIIDESTFFTKKYSIKLNKSDRVDFEKPNNYPINIYRSYSINVKEKSLFTYKRKNDLIIEYYKIYTNILATIKANKVDVKWYKNLISEPLEGVLEINDNSLKDDFIVCAFFSLAEYLIGRMRD